MPTSVFSTWCRQDTSHRGEWWNADDEVFDRNATGKERYRLTEFAKEHLAKVGMFIIYEDESDISNEDGAVDPTHELDGLGYEAESDSSDEDEEPWHQIYLFKNNVPNIEAAVLVAAGYFNHIYSAGEFSERITAYRAEELLELAVEEWWPEALGLVEMIPSL